jgi:hypothetical protein
MTILSTLTQYTTWILWDRRASLCSSGCPAIPYVAQAGLELSIPLLQPPEYWNYKHGPLCLASAWILARSINPNEEIKGVTNRKGRSQVIPICWWYDPILKDPKVFIIKLFWQILIAKWQDTKAIYKISNFSLYQ